MREASIQEVITISERIKQREAAKEVWELILAVAPDTAVIEAEFGNEYNDEGGYYLCLYSITFKDDKGRVIEDWDELPLPDQEKERYPTTYWDEFMAQTNSMDLFSLTEEHPITIAQLKEAVNYKAPRIYIEEAV